MTLSMFERFDHCRIESTRKIVLLPTSDLILLEAVASFRLLACGLPTDTECQGSWLVTSRHFRLQVGEDCRQQALLDYSRPLWRPPRIMLW